MKKTLSGAFTDALKVFANNIPPKKIWRAELTMIKKITLI
jgi:hypothetical protein